MLRPRFHRIPVAELWLLALAVAPATALMLQAFSGLAVELAPHEYRAMVPANVLVMVVGQPAVAWVARRIAAGPLLALAGLRAGDARVGRSGGAGGPGGRSPELVVVIVPPAVVAGSPRTGAQVSTVRGFQAVQAPSPPPHSSSGR